MNYKVAVITLSDSAARGEREDTSGPLIEEMLTPEGFTVVGCHLLPDDPEALSALLRELCDGGRADLILTTGGTGLSPRDHTPEATLAVIERNVPGISEAMRAASLKITPRAMLSRGVSGIRGRTLIVNLPGSPKAVRENLEVILPTLPHALAILTDREHNCARHTR
jgi:molybdenum cofactor synthesis domain-containing protein